MITISEYSNLRYVFRALFMLFIIGCIGNNDRYAPIVYPESRKSDTVDHYFGTGIRIETRSGHGSVSLSKALQVIADQYAFTFYNMGMRPSIPEMN